MLTGVKHFHFTHTQTHMCKHMHTQNSHLSHLESAIDFGSKALWATVSMATQWLRRPKFLSLSLIGEVSSLEEVRGGGRGRERERERHHSYSVLQASVGFIAHWQQQHPGPCILNRVLSSKHTLIRVLTRMWNLLISRLFYTLHYHSYNTQTQVYKVSVHLPYTRKQYLSRL